MPPFLPQSNLALRILSSLVLIPLVLGALWLGGSAFELLVLLVALAGFHEWAGLTFPLVRTRVRVMALAGLAATLTALPVFGAGSAFMLAAISFSGVFLAAGRFAPKGEVWGPHFTRALWLAAGVPYMALGGMALLASRGAGGEVTLYLLLAVWGTDIGGYIAGRTFKGPKIWPQISPKKTWSGLAGALVLAAAAGYVMAAPLGQGVLSMVLLSALLAVVAQAGDFFESYVKRKAGAKDSGRLIPGHGGVLDRIDGLVFAAPLLWAALAMGVFESVR